MVTASESIATANNKRERQPPQPQSSSSSSSSRHSTEKAKRIRRILDGMDSSGSDGSSSEGGNYNIGKPFNFSNDEDTDNDDNDGHMDECYICDDGGELICCDGCDKAYHAKCLKINVNTLPDIWHCPSCCNEKSKSKSKTTSAMTTTTPTAAATTNTATKTKTNDAELNLKSRGTKARQQIASSTMGDGKESSSSTRKPIVETAMPSCANSKNNDNVVPLTTAANHTTTTTTTTKRNENRNETMALVGVEDGKTLSAAAAAAAPIELSSDDDDDELMINNEKEEHARGTEDEKKGIHGTSSKVTSESCMEPRTNSTTASARGVLPMEKPIVGDRKLPSLHDAAKPPKHHNVMSSDSGDNAKKKLSTPLTQSPPINNIANESIPERVYRTVTIPEGVKAGDVFHVILNHGAKMGVICPPDVNPGDTLIALEPACHTPPISARNIAKRNARRLARGLGHGGDSSLAVGAFWEVLWPLLRVDGWSLFRGMYFDFGSMKLSHGNGRYFHTIVAVLEYIKSIPKYENAVKAFDAEVLRRKERKQGQRQPRKEKDVSEVDRWKYMDGSLSTKKHSRIGSNYQVRSLPRPREYVSVGKEDYTQEQLWDPSKATPEAFNFLNDVQHDRREEVFTTIHKANYDASGIPSPTKSAWKELSEDASFANDFHQKIIQSKKEMRVLVPLIGKPLDFCIWYYYHKYKPSENYQTLKKHMKELKNQAERNSDECAICDDGGNLICCDSCDKVYHLTCLGLNPSDVDNLNEWSCPGCTKEGRPSSDTSLASSSNASSPSPINGDNKDTNE